MNILQISPQIPLPPIDGGKISIWGVAKYLSLNGHKVHFVAYRKHTDVKSVIEELRKYTFPHILDVQTDNSVLGVLKNLFSPVPYNVSKYIRKELKIFLEEFLIKEPVDIVIVNNLHMGWVIDVIKKIKNIPVVLRQENVEMIIMKRFYEQQRNLILRYYSYLQYRKFIKYEPELCGKFDTCLMISNIDENTIKKYNSKIKTNVIPVGIENFLLNNEKKNLIPFSLAHIGSMSWFPNFDGIQWFIEDILPKVIKIVPQVKLFVYGGGSFSRLEVPKEVSNNVNIVGFVDDIWRELENKSLIVIPLRIGSGIRVKILEMLAAGQPVLTTSIGIEGIPVYNGQHLLVADNEEEMVAQIMDFFNDKVDKSLLVANGKEFIRQNYTWEIVADKFNNIFQSLI